MNEQGIVGDDPECPLKFNFMFMSAVHSRLLYARHNAIMHCTYQGKHVEKYSMLLTNLPTESHNCVVC